MTEHEIRLAAYSLKLSPAVKLVLLGVISRVNWETWRGEISFRDISARMNVSKSSVRSALKKLNEAGFITTTHQTTTAKSGATIYKRSLVEVNVDQIKGISKPDTPPCVNPRYTPVSKPDTPPCVNPRYTPVSKPDTPPLSIRDTLTIEDNNDIQPIITIDAPAATSRQIREQNLRRAQKLKNRSYRNY